MTLAIEPRPDEVPTLPATDGVVHFSDLKRMSLSPAHYRASVEEDFEATRYMRIGTIVHFLVLGPSNVHPLVRYDGGDRKGNAWLDFQAKTKKEHGDNVEIVTPKEWAQAVPAAESILADRNARRLLEGARHEVPISWVDSGIKCATRGLDVVGQRWVADLKLTSCTEPRTFMRHASKMLYPQQMAFYEKGCEQNAIDMSEGMFLIGCESTPPYAVTCFRMPEPVLMHGRKSIALWLERLRSCRENNFYPAYTQTIVDFELPLWMTDGDADE